ncbi:hypothetical protein FJTKL_09646 [Diaporthe vaccinii]|uniref:Uncharacterized protein n=1 Tax=Diaporthe vaccinii TaxID=105482 RepID=A0ABR4EN76_9PEZI
MWNPQQPAWTHPDDTIPWAGRNQHLLRRGVAKLDFAFVNYTSSFDASKVLYPTEGFNAKGYTYEYLSPSDLLSPAAVVEDGVLAKDGPSYKALVLLEQQYLTPEESAALLAFSEAGLPILIIGSAPKTSLGSTGQKEVTDNIEVLLSRTNVYQYPSKPVESIVDDLVDQGIQPRLSVVSSPGSDATGLYTLWRSSSANQSAVETIEVGTLQKLLPWSEIPQLAQASGVGTYETSFGFAAGAGGNATADGLALRLSFGPVRNTIRAWVNGRQLPPLDLTDAVSDVTEYLVDGRNSVRVEVTSSLGPRNPDLITGPDFDEFGLVGPVVGQVLRRVTVL